MKYTVAWAETGGRLPYTHVVSPASRASCLIPGVGAVLRSFSNLPLRARFIEGTHTMTEYRNRTQTTIPTELDSEEGEYAPAGEDQGLDASFTADQVANAFEVDVTRVHNALRGEFNVGPDGRVDSKGAQHLAEVILGDKPQDVQQAALMTLGAFTPRVDHEWGFGEKAEGDESDRLVRSADQGDEERG